LQSVGQVDVLIPCATSNIGYDGNKPAKDVSTASMTEMYTVNVLGLFHIVREFMALPSTASGGPKSVIHVSSAAAQLVVPGGSAYCSTKAAANQLITHFGYDDPKGNVKFYSYHPGAILTDLAKENMTEEMAKLDWEDGEIARVRVCTVFGRFADEMDLTEKLPGDFAVWLAGPEADFLTGRFVWAQWDVDELIGMKEKVAQDPSLLTIGLVK
jgi:NAD(P)-dependent dehydrogenase (short-subunit alcohol dehydrogenase family)